MESKKIFVVATMAMIMLVVTSSLATFFVDEDLMDLISDGRDQMGQDINNGCPRKIIERRSV